MEIIPFDKQYITPAARLFVQNLESLRQAVPVLPGVMQDTVVVANKLERLLKGASGIVALEEGRLVGYMAWLVIDNFRDTQRRGAYCLEWAHGAAPNHKSAIYNAMYRSASSQWAAAGCQLHAITLLAHDHVAEKAWFWNGFGLTVVDAVRPVQPLEAAPQSPLLMRKATPLDAEAFVSLDSEHCLHYTKAPIFMPLPKHKDADEFRQFLSQPKNSIWLALDGSMLAGFIRFDGYDFGGADIIASDHTIKINGAYFRPAYRGLGGASALLDAALRDYASQGMSCCAVDFESFNPEATSFWMRHFEPVCLSLLRVPESAPG
jgi:GNAT superfamily N-acetyltransferase